MENEYIKHFSKFYSDDIYEFATEDSLEFSKYIFKSKESGIVIGYCTHCDNEIIIKEECKHNDIIMCPICAAMCIVKDKGRGRSKLLDKAYFIYYENSVLDKNIITARGILSIRDYRNGYRNVKTKLTTLRWFIFQKGKSTMLKETSYWSVAQEIITCKSINSMFNDLKMLRIPKCYNLSNLYEAASKSDYFKYFKFNGEFYSIEYMALCTKYPIIECLIKEGFGGLILEKSKGNKTHSTVNWNATTIYKALRVNKSEFKELKKIKNVSFDFLMHLKELRSRNYSTEIMFKIANEYGMYYELIEDAAKLSSVVKVLNYLDRQFELNETRPSRYSYKSRVLYDYRDYLQECKQLKKDLTNTINLFPKNLYNAHQANINKIKYLSDKKLDVKIKAIYKDLSKLIFQDENFIIRPARSASEIVKEGEKLNHCVGRYAERHAKGETSIFFIRELTNVNKPFVTVEIKDNAIAQARAYKNANPNEEVSAFIEKFKNERLNKKRKKKTA